MSKFRHFVISKPPGYLSQFIANTRKNKHKFLGELADFPENIMAIGRLDAPSEGLLFLTTNGKVSELVRSKKFEKEYYAQVDGDITPEALNLLIAGVEIGINGEKYLTKPCKAFKLPSEPELNLSPFKIRGEHHGPTCWVSITLTEGKYRQIRKMTAAVGFATLRLVRVRIAEEHLADMEPGQVKEVEYFNLGNDETYQPPLTN